MLKTETREKEFAKLSFKRTTLEEILAIQNLKDELDKLNFLSEQADFWQKSPEKQKDSLQRKTNIEKTLSEYQRLLRLEDEIKTALNLSSENASDLAHRELIAELDSNLAVYKQSLNQLEILHLLSGKQDDAPALLAINSGAGGVESMDWVLMLLRMYKRWAEKNGRSSSIIDSQVGEEAGFKSILLKISGIKAYGFLKHESGVHRLVRISPFDSAKRRHTSFASVAVTPEIDDQVVVNISEKDLKIDVMRASGAGGQHVNTTDSAVRITHLPSGLVAKAQSERSQHKNRALAMKVLRSQLYQRELVAKQQEQEAFQATKKSIDFGQQIRSYVLYPYQLIKDHRSGYETSDTQAVLDGNIDILIAEAMLRAKKSTTHQ